VKACALSILLLLLVSCGDRKATEPPPPAVSLAVDPAAAFSHAQAMIDFGARHSDSPGATRTVDYLVSTSKMLGIQASIDQWQEGETTYRNVHAQTPGHGDRYVILASHYDTKLLHSVPNFVGANDSASSSGLLLELLRVISSAENWGGPPMRFVWFDGEECRVRYGEHDGLHGSKRMASTLEASGELESCRAMILLDMIGDKDLTITFPSNCDSKLLAQIFKTAEAQGVASHFGFFSGRRILDDHVPFFERGVPALDIIDFSYGPNNSFWHTSEDTLDKISPDSMAIVGNVVLAFLQELIPRE